jgi:hypothetical protein
MWLGPLLALALQDEFGELLRKLDDDAVAVREEATRALSRRGLEDLPALEKAWRETHDGERRGRLLRILPAVRVRRHDAYLETCSRLGREPIRAGAAALARLDARGALEAVRSSAGEEVDVLVATLVDVFREDEDVFRLALRERARAIPAEFLARTAACLSTSDPVLQKAALRN